MKAEDQQKFLQLLYRFGYDMKTISGYLPEYTVEELTHIYQRLILTFGKQCVNQGGACDIQQIKDVYFYEDEIRFDVVKEENGRLIEKGNIQLPDYKSKTYMMLKDFEFSLRWKINMVNSFYKNFEKHGNIKPYDESDVEKEGKEAEQNIIENEISVNKIQ
ncbi:hypothetical protein CWI37_0185p0030 [Hamiltosporidium tvaerminnensis]|uniref:Uncharacterized protein n=2 Tax=Hamiltosporidium TaxID=1176354 RepID=A0A4Q9LGS6_9MICR|nr:hypothetical protein LUQ84_002736 [Hamiltosporidium tvaerminnensis]TBU04084.1 hypothetical protein CWI37_0185p0030 [Hamiltosporidium tvaerminnensis]TBU06635.1 hypothetical protein CWI39_0451p0020 [Hamiltosporidium magnivora]